MTTNLQAILMKRLLLAATLLLFVQPAMAQVQRFKATVENVGTVYPVLKSGVFNTPAGTDSPGPILPGQTYEFRFTAPVGTHVSFATMFVQSNDLFFAPEPSGIPLYDAEGNPNTGDVTEYVFLWDAGTEFNEEPGVGANQAPRQSGPNTGIDENGSIVRIDDGLEDVNGYTYPNVADVIRVEISHNMMGFRVAVKNVSSGLITASGVVPIPMAPGTFAVHGPDVLNFEPGLAATPGLEAIAEDGNPSIAAEELEPLTGVTVPLSPGIFAVHDQDVTLFNGWDPAPAPLEPLAEDGNPGEYPAALSGLAGVSAYGVFNTPNGASGPGPLFPGGAYSFEFDAQPGDYFSFATMYVQSNDMIYAFGNDHASIPLFDDQGMAKLGDITDYVSQWDAGVEHDEEPGVGPNQAPRQAGPNTGETEGRILVFVNGMNDGYSYPSPASVIKVTLEEVAPPEPVELFVKIENVSGGSSLATPFAPGPWVIHRDANPLFSAGEADRGLGLEAVAEDGNPGPLAEALMTQAGILSSGVFNTPFGASGPGPLLPGRAYEFAVTAVPGDYLNFATMFVQSNDLFYSPNGMGIALFNEDGSPRFADVTVDIQLWDAGTEVNEEPGLGANQAPRQSGPNVGDDETGTVVAIADGAEDAGGYTYPNAADVIKVTISETPSMPEPVQFYVRIDNVSGASSLPTPFAPGPWAIHRDANPLFTAGEADRGDGLEAVAEDGNPGPIAEALMTQDGIISSGVFNTPLGSAAPGALVPGGSYEFIVTAVPGDHLNFATMFVQSNDLFYSPDGTGIALFDGSGSPRFVNVTTELQLWDAGTEVNQEPGAGGDQAPRQAGPNVGEGENGSVVSIADGTFDVAGYGYPNVADVISVTISDAPSTPFTIVIENVSTDVPLSPGAWALHREGMPLFEQGVGDRGEGLERLAEDGSPNELLGSLRKSADVRAAGVFTTPMGSDSPDVILPGGMYQFTVYATPGDRLSFATMFVQSNDLFYAPNPEGIALFNDEGQPMDLNLLAQTHLWDAGTEVNEEPGVGLNQAPRQTAPNTGDAENGMVTLIADGVADARGFTYPTVAQVVSPSLLGGTSVGVEGETPANERLTGITLNGNYPNPFSGSTTIEFEVAEAGDVQLDVYNVLGRRVVRVVDGPVPSGVHQVQWDARDGRGSAVPSGLYFYRLSKSGEQQVGSMSIVR